MVSGPGGFAGDFVAALAGDFAAHGAAAIAELRERNPGAYLRLCASVLRHEAATRDPLEDLTDAQLAARLEAIGARLADAGEHPHLADAAAAPRPRRVVAKDAVGEAARGPATRPPAATGFEGAGGKAPGDDLAAPLSRDLGRRREDRLAQRRGDDPAAPGTTALTQFTIARDRSRPRARTERPAAPAPPHSREACRRESGERESRASWTPASAGVTATESGSRQSGTALARDGRVADRRNGAGATPRRSGAFVAVRLSVFTIVVATLSGIAAPAAAPTLDVTAEEERRILRHGPWPPASLPDPSNRVSGRPGAIAFGRALFFDPRLSTSTSSVMPAPGLDPGGVPGIHVPPPARPLPAHTAMVQDVDGRNKSGHDDKGAGMTTWAWALREP